MVNQKQIALLLCSVAMVLMTMSVVSILMTADVRKDMEAKIDEHQRLIDKLTDNQVAMLAYIDPDQGEKPLAAPVAGNPSKDTAPQDISEPTSGNEVIPEADAAQSASKPEKDVHDQATPGPQAGTAVSVPDDTILAALSTPLSSPPTRVPSSSIGHPSLMQDQPVEQPRRLQNVDSILAQKVASNWHRPPSARDGMSVQIVIKIARDGDVQSAKVTKSSGDKYFDQSAIDAIMAVQQIPEIQQVSDDTYKTLYKERNIQFSPEALAG